MKKKPKTKAGKRSKVKKTMDEWKAGELHSGSKQGPVVKNQKQAIAIALKQSGQSKYDKMTKPKKKRGRKNIGKELST